MTRSIPVLIAPDGTRYPLNKDGLHTIGSENCAILLHDPSILPHHASLVVARLRVNLRAEDGAVYLNGKLITGMVIVNEGDLIKLGEVTLILAIHQIEDQATHKPPFIPRRREEAFPPIDPMFTEDQKSSQTSTEIAPVVPPVPGTAPFEPPKPITVAPPLEPEPDFLEFEEQSAEIDERITLPERETAPMNDLGETAIMPEGHSEEFGIELDADEDETVRADRVDLSKERGGAAMSEDKPEPLADNLPIEHDTAKKKKNGATTDDDVNFSAYYPREVSAGSKSAGFYVYAYLESALAAVQRDIEKFEAELGGSIPRPRTTDQSSRIQPDARLTVVIECPDLEFAQPSVTKKWREPFTRFDFEFYPPTALPEGGSYVAIAQIIVLVEGIEIARIPNCAIEIIGTGVEFSNLQPTSANPAISNPLAQAKLERQVARMYQRIFVSYSRKDVEVVELYRKAQLALGNDVFKDTESIRAGEDWQAALARFIDQADIFQLFWSSNSCVSDGVRDEWEYALDYRCQGDDDACEGFIRPVYWEQPMPPAPAKLNHLNFRYVQFE